jgi:hypothetical protein
MQGRGEMNIIQAPRCDLLYGLSQNPDAGPKSIKSIWSSTIGPQSGHMMRRSGTPILEIIR